MKNICVKLILAVMALLAMNHASATYQQPDCTTGGSNPACTTWNLTNTGYSSQWVYNSVDVNSGGHTLKMRAYASGTASTASDGTITYTDSPFKSAFVGVYGGGIGVSNCYDSITNDGSQCGELGSPQHAIDTDGKRDFLLLEFDTVVSAQAFQIGWAGEDSDVQLWVGSAATGPGLDLTNACVSGCAKTLTSLGFSSGVNHENVALNTNVVINPPNNSRYLLVSGQLGESNDYFKFKSITTCLPLPSPGTLSLFGFVMLGMLGLRGSGKRL